MDTSHFDIAIVGAGANGLCAALGFAQQGFSTVLIGDVTVRSDGRTVALLQGSVRLLQKIGAWDKVVPFAAPLETMRMVDDKGSLFQVPPVSFDAHEIGLDAFGWNVENYQLVDILARACRLEKNLAWIQRPLVSALFAPDNVTLETENRVVKAHLVVAADGRSSRLREQAQITTRRWSYPQMALTTLLHHERPHQNISTEFHTREGPFTLVPLPLKDQHRSSLVWVMSPDKAQNRMSLNDEALSQAIQKQSRSILGTVKATDARALVPMTGLYTGRYYAQRLALIGEAAHVFPPIGAQGLNLGFRDVASLLKTVSSARQQGLDFGSKTCLQDYNRSRLKDVTLRTAAVDGLSRSLLSNILPVNLARGIGLLMVDKIKPLRLFVMRQGLGQ